MLTVAVINVEKAHIVRNYLFLLTCTHRLTLRPSVFLIVAFGWKCWPVAGRCRVLFLKAENKLSRTPQEVQGLNAVSKLLPVSMQLSFSFCSRVFTLVPVVPLHRQPCSITIWLLIFKNVTRNFIQKGDKEFALSFVLKIERAHQKWWMLLL